MAHASVCIAHNKATYRVCARVGEGPPWAGAGAGGRVRRNVRAPAARRRWLVVYSHSSRVR